MAYERLDRIYTDGSIWNNAAIGEIDNRFEDIQNSMSVVETDILPFTQTETYTLTNAYMCIVSNKPKLSQDQYSSSYAVHAYPVVANQEYKLTVTKDYPESRTCFVMFTTNLDYVVANGVDGLTPVVTGAKADDTLDVNFETDGFLLLGTRNNIFYDRIELIQHTSKFVNLNETMSNLTKIEKSLESPDGSQHAFNTPLDSTVENVYMIFTNNDANCKLNQDQYSSQYSAEIYPVKAGVEYIVKITVSPPEQRTCPIAFSRYKEYLQPNAYDGVTPLCSKGCNEGDEYRYTFETDGFIAVAVRNHSTRYASVYVYEYELINVSEELNKIKESMKGAGNDSFICCPDDWYAVVGKEFVIYYDGIVKGMDAGLDSPFGVYTDIRCQTLGPAGGASRRQDRLWRIPADKLTSSHVGDHTVYITAMSQSGTIIDEKVVTLHVTEPKNPESTTYICCIGDSLTNNGPIVPTCEEHFKALDGNPPVFIGNRGSNTAKHEGYPGWTFGSFVGDTGTSYHIFDVPADTVCSVGDVYVTASKQYTIHDMRVEGLDGLLRLRCTCTSKEDAPETGTLSLDAGAASSQDTIVYSAYERESGNPFWNNTESKIDIASYRSKMGMGDAYFDVVFILLGTNDCISTRDKTEEEIAKIVTNAKTLVDAIQADAASYPTKIVLNLTPPDANTTSSWQVYADSTQGSRKIYYWKNLWRLRVALYEEFSTGYTNVYLGSAGQQVDRYYGFPYQVIKSCSRIQVDEIYHTNSVHPNTDGYKQIGDAYYLIAQNLLNT